MRSRLALCLALALVLGFTTPAAAIPAVPVDNGMVIGGQWTMANTTKAEVTNLTDLKAVTVVYTATWCEAASTSSTPSRKCMKTATSRPITSTQRSVIRSAKRRWSNGSGTGMPT